MTRHREPEDRQEGDGRKYHMTHRGVEVWSVKGRYIIAPTHTTCCSYSALFCLTD